MKISSATSTSDIVKNWCDHMQFFARVQNSKELRGPDGKVSDYAALEALYSEIYNVGSRSRQLMAAVRGGTNLDKFPLLTSTMERQFSGLAGAEEYKFRLYLEGIFKEILETIPLSPGVQRERLVGDSPTFTEMVEFFKYLGKLPSAENPDSISALSQALLKNWKSTPGAMDRLNEAIEAVSQLKANTTRDGFNSWKIPSLDRN